MVGPRLVGMEAGASALLGFQLEARSAGTFDPEAVTIRDAEGDVVPVLSRQSDLPGDKASLVVARLAAGDYTIDVTGENGAAGAFRLKVYLVGDADGNHRLDSHDAELIQRHFGAAAGDYDYRLADDANRDGHVDVQDLVLWRRNFAYTQSGPSAVASLLSSTAPDADPIAGAPSGGVYDRVPAVVPQSGYDPDAPTRFFQSDDGWVQPLAANDATAGGVFAVDPDTQYLFSWTFREAGYNNSMGYFKVDDANGRIRVADSASPDGFRWLDPTNAADAAAYRAEAAARAVEVFAPGERPNDPASGAAPPLTKAVSPAAGVAYFSIYARQNGDSYLWLPFSEMNVDQYAHFQSGSGGFEIEDLSNDPEAFPNPGGMVNDADFDDMVLEISQVWADVDIDVDSNNDGAIDPDNAGTDDPVEEDAPGKIVLFESTTQGDDLFGGDYDLTQVVLASAPPTAALAGTFETRLVLRNQADGFGQFVRVWADPYRATLLDVDGDGVIHFGADQLPASVWIEGVSAGMETLELVTDYVQSGESPVEAGRDLVAVTTEAPSVADVVFRQVNAAHYGQLDLGGNPDGADDENGDELADESGELKFMGGDRFFPGAQSADANTTANNVVRVRAILNGVTDADVAAGLQVYFRAYDVDDPAADATIDPNGDGETGSRDNRGRVAGVDLFLPGGSSGLPGNSVEPTEGGSGFEGYLRIIDADGIPFVWQSQGATVGAPIRKDGDTFYAEVDLATSFAPGDNFRVGATFHRQNMQDRDTVPTRDTHFNGSPQLSVWRHFHVEQDRMAPTVSADSTAGNVTASAAIADAAGLARITTDITELNDTAVEEDQFVGGVFRHGGKNYHIVANSAGGANHVTFDIIANPANIANGPVTVYEDDFSPINGPVDESITATGEVADAGGTLREVTPEEFAMTAGALVGGFLRVSFGDKRAFPIVQNSATTIMIDVGGGEDPMGVFFRLFRPLGIAVPTTRVDPSATDDGLYDLLTETADLNSNKYAAAYLQPELDGLDQYDASNVAATPHLPSNAAQAEAIVAPATGSRNMETDVFWIVYVTTGYEYYQTADADPVPTNYRASVLGASSGAFSVIFMETIRDFINTKTAFSENETLARVTVHEIGHQFGLAVGGGADNSGHRANPNDIMNHSLELVESSDWNFHPSDIVAMRNRSNSPD